MTNEQYEQHYIAEMWLMRTWDDETELEQLKVRREKVIASLSGIGKYDSNSVPGGSDTNTTESKNIEYSILTEKIEKLQNKIFSENARTHAVIYQIEDNRKDASKIRGMLEARYVNRMSWRKVGELYHYQERHSYNYRTKCLEAIYPYVPKGEMENEG